MPTWKKYAIGLPVLCVVVVLVWFVSCIALGRHEYADRGGAIGVMISFAALFLLATDRYHSIEVLDASSAKLFESLSAVSDDDPRVLARTNAMRIDAIKLDLGRARIQTRWENYSLSVSSVISTLFWGFGDIFASWYT